MPTRLLMRPRAATLALVLALAADARAAIEVAGGWVLHFDSAPSAVRHMMVKRTTDDAVAVTVESAPFLNRGDGTFDPATRMIHAGDSALTRDGMTQACSSLRLDGVVSADGTTMTGNATFVGGFFHGFCFASTGDFTAIRTTCGNGIIDPGESCDPADIFAGDDCCSRTCSLEPTTVGCSSREQAALRCLPSSQCDGASPSCPPPPLLDSDGDGIVDPCEDCPGGSRLTRVRIRDRDGLFIRARVGLPPGGIDPVATGVRFLLGPSVNLAGIALWPGTYTAETGGWKVKRAGRLWQFKGAGTSAHLKATVRSVAGRVTIRLAAKGTPENYGVSGDLRFVTLMFDALLRSRATCSDIDLAGSGCAVRKRATACR